MRLTRPLLASPVYPRVAEKRELPIPHNLANYASLVSLLDVLDPFCEAIGYGRGCESNGACCTTAGHTLSASSVSDAVGALNRLKRLRNQATSRHLDIRLSSC